MTNEGKKEQTLSANKYKLSVINIKNPDERCIIWSLLAFLHYDNLPLTKSGKEVKEKNEPRHYKQFLHEIVEPDNIAYPINVQTDIKKFERSNNMKINVFMYDEKDTKFENLLTIYNTSDRNEKVCNLLIISLDGKEHIVWIKHINKLFRMKHHHARMFPCCQCLCESFDSEEKLKKHQDICFEHEAIHCILPRKYDPLEVDDEGKP